MKNKVLTALFTIVTLFANAQSDSSYSKTDSILVKPDTIKVGNFFIVKKGNEYIPFANHFNFHGNCRISGVF